MEAQKGQSIFELILSLLARTSNSPSSVAVATFVDSYSLLFTCQAIVQQYGERYSL